LFPALWDVSTYQRILEERTRRRHGGSPPASPVSGCVICARCEHPLSTMKPPKQARFFRCCTHQERSITGLDCHYNYIREDVVIAFIEADLRLDTPEGLDALLARHAPTHSRLAAELTALQDLRSEPLETVRSRLQRAGVKVFVEEGEIVALVYGQFDYHYPP